MIVDSGKYYLYRHIHLDTNEPFYIGVGTKTIRVYIRAFTKSNRNIFWKKISVAKKGKYSNKNKNVGSRKVQNMETGQIYRSIRAAAINSSVNISTLRRMIFRDRCKEFVII